MIVRTRFAPSPTGYIHIGNLRTALFSYLYAKSVEGVFLLRIEDTDRERSKVEYTTALLDDLQNLGILWDQEILYQSQRKDIYAKFYHDLFEQGLMYRCFCSEQKLSLSRKLQLAQGLPPRYAGTCLKLAPEEITSKLNHNELYCWRFKVPKNVIIKFEDLIKGEQHFNSNDFGDFIIKRQDGASPFMFCSVIDDVLQGVTHVLRGEDHVSNTPRQLLILQALNLEPPRYGHFSLLTNNNENNPKLSKRTGSESLRDFLKQGYLPAAILNYLARLGHTYINQGNNLLGLTDLALHFKLEQISSNSAKHDIVHLKFWQKQAMLALTNKEFFQLLSQENLEFAMAAKELDHDVLDSFLSLIKSNILMPQEALAWFKVLFYDNLSDAISISPALKLYWQNIDPTFFQEIIDSHDFATLIQKLKDANFKNKEIFMNLRMILTGKEFGPEIIKIFEIMGMIKIKKRVMAIRDIITS